MTETTNADKLRISEGFVVWVIGATVEETSLLDPLPEGAVTIERPDEDPDSDDDRDDDHQGEAQHERVDAAVLVSNDRAAVIDDFDEVLPQLGSIPIVWVTYPLAGRSDLDEDVLQDLLSDYGWHAVESIALDETWAAMRILQS